MDVSREGSNRLRIAVLRLFGELEMTDMAAESSGSLPELDDVEDVILDQDIPRNEVHPSAAVQRWVLTPPSGTRITSCVSFSYLEFQKGREREVAKWLRDSADMYMKEAEKAVAEEQLKLAEAKRLRREALQAKAAAGRVVAAPAMTAVELAKEIHHGEASAEE